MPPIQLSVTTGTTGRPGKQMLKVTVNIMLTLICHKIQILLLMLTKADEDPYIGFGGWTKNSVDQPEGVENL